MGLGGGSRLHIKISDELVGRLAHSGAKQLCNQIKRKLNKQVESLLNNDMKILKIQRFNDVLHDNVNWHRLCQIFQTIS